MISRALASPSNTSQKKSEKNFRAKTHLIKRHQAESFIKWDAMEEASGGEEYVLLSQLLITTKDTS